ncbi:MAG TPA: T9SS type A sorting domain-containing protein, partial [Bacteroidia bacterium]|nr:T9SS type A sorting domain-containing protein [Bacteroidia bacterium]
VAGATTTVALDPLTVPTGTHYLNVSVTQSGDGNVSNNISVKRITVTGATALPYSQDFETKRFPADNWLVLNEDNDATFMRSRLASINGSSSLWFYAPLQIPAGSKDIVQLEPFDLTTLAEPVLAFDVACLHDNSISTTASLKILASTDCGSTFSQIFEKTGTALTTAEGSASDVFVPVAEQWRKDSVNLKALNSFNNVILRFEYTSGNANALFIDNLQIDRLGVIYPDASNVNVSVYGQSTYGMLDFSVLLLKTVDFNIDIFDVAGRRVFSKSYSGSAVSDRLSLHQLNAGVYFFRVTSGNDSKSVKIFFR